MHPCSPGGSTGWSTATPSPTRSRCAPPHAPSRRRSTVAVAPNLESTAPRITSWYEPTRWTSRGSGSGALPRGTSTSRSWSQESQRRWLTASGQGTHPSGVSASPSTPRAASPRAAARIRSVPVRMTARCSAGSMPRSGASSASGVAVGSNVAKRRSPLPAPTRRTSSRPTCVPQRMWATTSATGQAVHRLGAAHAAASRASSDPRSRARWRSSASSRVGGSTSTRIGGPSRRDVTTARSVRPFRARCGAARRRSAPPAGTCRGRAGSVRGRRAPPPPPGCGRRRRR